MLDSANWEISFTEILQLIPHTDKKDSDWKKINCLCKDGIDIRFGKLFKGKDIECADAKFLIDELLQIPFIGTQVISNRVIVFGIDFYNNSFYHSSKIREYTIPLRVSDCCVVKKFLKNSLIVKCYLEKIANNFVQIKDRINLLPNLSIVENTTISSSMSISTTF
ncbi:9591_t:CDS:1 [Entrophospora sp. SA101]|nr:9591_t:CDS:1 [Entrophospora sp. SA101]